RCLTGETGCPCPLRRRCLWPAGLCEFPYTRRDLPISRKDLAREAQSIPEGAMLIAFRDILQKTARSLGIEPAMHLVQARAAQEVNLRKEEILRELRRRIPQADLRQVRVMIRTPGGGGE